METFTEDMFEFRKARIGGDEGAGVRVMGGLRGRDGLREYGTGNLLGDEGMDLEEIGINAGNWVDSAQDRNYWRALVNAALNLRVP